MTAGIEIERGERKEKRLREKRKGEIVLNWKDFPSPSTVIMP